MMSADRYVPDPLNGQTWNRYSYVINNPLAFSDPNGYCFLGMCSWGGAISTFFGRSFGVLFRDVPILGTLFEIGAVALCLGNPVCAIPVAFASTAFVAGVTSGRTQTGQDWRTHPAANAVLRHAISARLARTAAADVIGTVSASALGQK